MTSILVSATQAAHSAAASLLSKAQIAPGVVISTGLKVKENEVETPFELVLTGKVRQRVHSAREFDLIAL
jgi:hypothetical protein